MLNMHPLHPRPFSFINSRDAIQEEWFKGLHIIDKDNLENEEIISILLKCLPIVCVYSDYGTLDYQPGFSTEFCTPITVLLTGVTHGMLHELVYWSKQFDSCHTYCKSSIQPPPPRGGYLFQTPLRGNGWGLF